LIGDHLLRIDRPRSRDAPIRALGVAAMLPIVTSVIAPTALQAQSLQSQTFSFTGAVHSRARRRRPSVIDAFGARRRRIPESNGRATPSRPRSR
jgi:hypothetical protein